MRKQDAVPGAAGQAEPTAIPQPAGTPAAATPALNERYLIEGELSRGGMGRVFAARDVKLGRRVAIKFLAPGTHHDDELRRFEQEARTAGSLNHPNVLTVHDVGMLEGEPYIVSELLEGGTLREHLQGKPFSLSKAIDCATQLASGLGAAHERGIVHRDLKPENLFITYDGRLKILDFGIAKLLAPESAGPDLKSPLRTQTGAIIGTIGYMSPEQVRGEHADRRSDVFSAGAILYEMLSGERAFKAGSLVETAYAIINDEPPDLPEQISADLQELVWRCLEKKPEERFQSAGELAVQLQRLSTSSGSRSETCSPVEARQLTPPVAAPVAHRWLLRWPFIVASTLAVSVALLWALNVGRWREHLVAGTRTAKESAGAPAPPLKARRSVAVLGFKNLSRQPDQAWLSTALSEMLTTELAAGEMLRTIPEENVARMKAELALKDAESLAPDSLVRLRKNLGADLVVVGAYLSGKEAGGQMRLDVRLQDAVAGETIAAVAETGSESDLFDLVSRTGSRLRKKLGVADVSKAEAAVVRESLPTDPDAARLYSQGLAKLRVFDALGARDLLEKAVAVDPNHALAHSALSRAWSALGYDAKAQAEAKRAFDLSVSLSREKRLGVEGRYRETTREWNKAVEIYRTLWDFFPDNVDYGLRLVQVQISGGKGTDVLATVEALRKLSPPQRDDPRIDLAEAQAAHSLSDLRRAQKAAASAAAKGEAQEAKLLVAEARFQEGRALQRLGERAKALAAYEEARRIYDATGDRAGVARALNAIANDQENLFVAMGAYEQALAVFREVGNQSAQAGVLSNIALALTELGDSDGAKQRHEQVLALRRGLGNKRDIAASLNNLGNALWGEGKLAEAKSSFQESLTLAREIEDNSQVSIALIGLAGVLMEQGELAGAAKTYQQSVTFFREVGEKDMLAIALNDLGEALYKQGDLSAARKSTEEALAIRNQLGKKGSIAKSELLLASMAIEEGRPLEAEPSARRAVEEFQAEHAADDEAQARTILARSLLAQGKPSMAREAVGRAVELAQKSQERTLHFSVNIISARVRASLGKPAEAKASLKAILAEATKHGFVNYQLEARLALGEIEMKSGEPAAGRAHLEDLEKKATATGFGLIARKAAAANR